MVQERFEVLPAAPVENEQQVPLCVRERARPCPAEVVRTQELPAALILLVDELLASVLEPAPERTCRGDREHRLVARGVAHVADRLDPHCEVARDRRLAELVTLPLLDAHHQSRVRLDDILRRDVEDLGFAKILRWR